MIRRRFALSLTALALTASALAGCGGTESKPAEPASKAAEAPAAKPAEAAKPAPGQTAYPITVKDAAGRDVTIAAEPKRIVSLAPSNTELVFALGKSSALVGRSQFDDYPAEVKNIDSVGGFTPPNYEAIVGKKPDIVLMTSTAGDAIKTMSEQYKLTVYVVDPKNFDDLYTGIQNLGVVLNAQEAATKVVTDMKAAVKEVTDKTSKAATKPKVFYQVWDNPLMTAGTGTFIDDLINLAGAENVGASVKGWANFADEQVAAANPDFIIASTKENAAKVKDRKGWESFKAVKEGKVLGVEDANLVSRPGPRLVLGLKWFAVTLHPELFQK